MATKPDYMRTFDKMRETPTPPQRPEATCPTCEVTKRVLGTLIMWIAQSANSPLSHAAARELLEMLDADTLRQRRPQ